MATVEKIDYISPEEYLEGEKHSPVKHEYVAGQVYAMVGASGVHNLITLAIASTLRAHVRGGPCQVFMADMKVRVANAFYYPDVFVACEHPDRHEYYRERPILIIEVASPSTETRDNLEKRIAYQTLPSLREYVLVSQDETKVRIFRRIDDGWELETCAEDDNVRLRAVDLDIPIAAVYEDVWR